jgi:pyruvate ferredoxin oxidoreductase alpha subunit
VLVSFIGGLGGRDLAAEEFDRMIRVTRQAVAEGRAPPPRLLFTAEDLQQVRELQAIARGRRSGEKRND